MTINTASDWLESGVGAVWEQHAKHALAFLASFEQRPEPQQVDGETETGILWLLWRNPSRTVRVGFGVGGIHVWEATDRDLRFYQQYKDGVLSTGETRRIIMRMETWGTVEPNDRVREWIRALAERA